MAAFRPTMISIIVSTSASPKFQSNSPLTIKPVIAPRDPAVSALGKALEACKSKNAMWKEIKYDLGKLLMDTDRKEDAKREFASLIEVDFKFKDAAVLYQHLAGVAPSGRQQAVSADDDMELDLDISEDDITNLDGI